MTGDSAYARMAEEIIGYLDQRLATPDGTFWGCEDFLRNEGEASSGKEYFSIIDRCIYTDANSDTALAYLEAGQVFGRSDCTERAIRCLGFLWTHCALDDTSIAHSYFAGAAEPLGLLIDQSAMGTAELAAYESTGDGEWLKRATMVGDFIVRRLKNPEGGFRSE